MRMNCLICDEWLKKPLPCDQYGICPYDAEIEDYSSSVFDFDHDLP